MLGGRQFGSLVPERGLRKGDPLSPYLFLLCTESFSSLLQQAENEGRIQGVSICRGAPQISHLLFADDTLIFTQASAAGSRAIQDSIADDLGVRVENKIELNLGLPSRVAHSKRELFATIRDRVWSRITGWNEKLLSQAGKAVLIKSIIQAIPTYAMGCFKLPVTLLKEIHGMIANFWWNNRRKNKVHWISFDKLCASKLHGGLGFRQLHFFNLAMLAKQLWRIMRHPDKLLSRVLRARYFPQGTVFYAPLGCRPSFTWRSLHAAQGLFRAGCRWHVGNGSLIRDLVDQSTGDWDSATVSSIFWPIDAELILNIPFSRLGAEDLVVWHYTNNGLFSVRSAYHLALAMEFRPYSSNSREAEQQWWRRMWQMRLPGKVKVFVWRAALNALPTSLNLLKRIPGTSSVCPFCHEGRKMLFMHLLTVLSPGKYGNVDSSALKSCRTSLCWAPPPLGSVKINFDGPLFDHGTELGFRVIARDSAGACIAWLSRRVAGRATSELVEAMVAREAVLLAVRHGWQSILIERDCAVLISKLRTAERDCSLVGPVTEDILTLATAFSACHFLFVKRECNSVAHALAKSASGFAEGGTNIPSAVANPVALDLMS
ncbi:UNVERIFIED_CONTAM: putative ribonuclease H protein [Sesamum latifolium]|uniref:Ribonuclease H protein n=1 Tax=Sesamum latifolium TaxID=2727402 RepID=A0AAW2XLC5_9LAMI